MRKNFYESFSSRLRNSESRVVKSTREPRREVARDREVKAGEVLSLQVTYGVESEFFSSFPVFGLPLIRGGCYDR